MADQPRHQQHLYCFQCDDFHHWDQASKTLTANDRKACQRGGRYKARSILGSEGMISKVTGAELHMALKSRHRGQSYHIPSERTEHHLEYHFVEPHSAPPQQQRPVDNSAQNLYANSVDLWTSWKACSRVTKYKLGTEYRFAYESFMLCRTESWTISWETLRAICYEYLTYLWAIEQWPPSVFRPPVYISHGLPEYISYRPERLSRMPTREIIPLCEKASNHHVIC